MSASSSTTSQTLASKTASSSSSAAASQADSNSHGVELIVKSSQNPLTPGQIILQPTVVIADKLPTKREERTPLRYLCIIDTSGSMESASALSSDAIMYNPGHTDSITRMQTEFIESGNTITVEGSEKPGGTRSIRLNRLARSISLLSHVYNNFMEPGDSYALVTFNHEGKIIQDFTTKEAGIKFSNPMVGARPEGGTNIGNGFTIAKELIKDFSAEQMQNLRVILFSDGQTRGEQNAGVLASSLTVDGITPVIIPFGFGSDYNKPLLEALAIETGMRFCIQALDPSTAVLRAREGLVPHLGRLSLQLTRQDKSAISEDLGNASLASTIQASPRIIDASSGIASISLLLDSKLIFTSTITVPSEINLDVIRIYFMKRLNDIHNLGNAQDAYAYRRQGGSERITQLFSLINDYSRLKLKYPEVISSDDKWQQFYQILFKTQKAFGIGKVEIIRELASAVSTASSSDGYCDLAQSADAFIAGALGHSPRESRVRGQHMHTRICGVDYKVISSTVNLSSEISKQPFLFASDEGLHSLVSITADDIAMLSSDAITTESRASSSSSATSSSSSTATASAPEASLGEGALLTALPMLTPDEMKAIIEQVKATLSSSEDKTEALEKRLEGVAELLPTIKGPSGEVKTVWPLRWHLEAQNGVLEIKTLTAAFKLKAKLHDKGIAHQSSLTYITLYDLDGHTHPVILYSPKICQDENKQFNPLFFIDLSLTDNKIYDINSATDRNELKQLYLTLNRHGALAGLLHNLGYMATGTIAKDKLPTPPFSDDEINRLPETFDRRRPELRCPITQLTMQDPVRVAMYGFAIHQAYERTALLQWFEHKHDDPVSRVAIDPVTIPGDESQTVFSKIFLLNYFEKPENKDAAGNILHPLTKKIITETDPERWIKVDINTIIVPAEEVISRIKFHLNKQELASQQSCAASSSSSAAAAASSSSSSMATSLRVEPPVITVSAATSARMSSALAETRTDRIASRVAQSTDLVSSVRLAQDRRQAKSREPRHVTARTRRRSRLSRRVSSMTGDFPSAFWESDAPLLPMSSYESRTLSGARSIAQSCDVMALDGPASASLDTSDYSVADFNETAAQELTARTRSSSYLSQTATSSQEKVASDSPITPIPLQSSRDSCSSLFSSSSCDESTDDDSASHEFEEDLPSIDSPEIRF